MYLYENNIKSAMITSKVCKLSSLRYKCQLYEELYTKKSNVATFKFEAKPNFMCNCLKLSQVLRCLQSAKWGANLTLLA